MELSKLRRDMGAIEGGRWVGADEVPGLMDIRVKVRGTQCDTVRDMISAQQRAGADLGKAMAAIVADHCLIDITGLTSGGEKVTVEDLRPMLADPAMEPLGLLLLDAVRAVDATREADQKVAEKN